MNTQPRSRKRKQVDGKQPVKKQSSGGQFKVYITVDDKVVQTFTENASSFEAVVQRYREEKMVKQIQKVVGDKVRWYVEIERA